jgi:hypothetical protein
MSEEFQSGRSCLVHSFVMVSQTVFYLVSVCYLKAAHWMDLFVSKTSSSGSSSSRSEGKNI